MKAAVVTIGDEILIGQITDTNSAYMAKALDKLGIEIVEMASISDTKTQIITTLERFQNRVDFVFLTGGLGPTRDDVTKKTLCEYLGDELILNQDVLNHVANLLQKHYGRELSPMNREQALVPSRASVLFNQVGTAPGMWMPHGKTVFVSLPGVPYEMKHIFEREILPKIAREFKRPYILHRTIMTYGIGESLLAERLVDFEDALPNGLKLSYLPSPGLVRLRVSGYGTNEELLKQAVDAAVRDLSGYIGDWITSYDEGQTLEVVVGNLLRQQEKTVALAESCTGGKVAHLLTSVPGASAYFNGGAVCYSAESKMQILGVSQNTIREHSVVSAQVAAEMALGARRVFHSDFGIGITGNAGPATDETSEGVGVVYISVAGAGEPTTMRYDFGQPREKVIDRSANKSLEMLQKEILKNVQQ